MIVGVSAYSFAKHMKATGADCFQIADLAKQMGFDAIEYTGAALAGERAADDLELACRLRAHCEEIGLKIVALCQGADFLNRGPEEVEKIKHHVDLAAAMGAPVVRHDAFWALPEGMDWRKGVEKIAPIVRDVTSYAQEKGVRTCTENHGMILQEAERVETLIRMVDHPNYGWLVDIGNFLCADDNPLRSVPIAAPYAFHAQVKDFLFKPFDGDDPGSGWITTRAGNHLRGTVAGHGVVPIRRCLQLLRKAGYQGPVSYEFEGMEDNLAALETGLAFIRKALEA